MCGVREEDSFILWHVAVQFFQHSLLKSLSSPHCVLPFLSKICRPHTCGFNSGLSFLFRDCLYVYIWYFDCYSFIIYLEIGKLDAYSLVLLFQDCFGCSKSYVIPCEFYNCLFYFCNSAIETWIDHALTLSISLGSVLVTQSCPILWDAMDCGPPRPSVHGILQVRVLEWIATPFSNIFG